MNRRDILKVLAAGPLLAPFGARAAAPTDMKGVESLQRDWKTLLASGAASPLPTEPLKRSNEEWRKVLTPPQYNVLREEGTERAGTSPLNGEKRPGVFVCVACDLPLFTSAMKYESGTGWPSFFTLIPGVFGTKKDFKLIYPRTEYHCIRCGGHHGHLFDDGPRADPACVTATTASRCGSSRKPAPL